MSRRSVAPATAFSYLRFSARSQADGDSVRRQQKLRDAWLAKSGAVLDSSLDMKDEGVSAFTGGHRQNPDRHALAAFLELVRRGRIPRGSYLIVESLDRLSREHIRPALTLLLNLIDAGVRVVQLLPVEAVYDDQVEPMQLMMAIMELSRGHSESAVKSKRVGEAWRRKKAAAAADKLPITRRAPAWLSFRGGRFVLDEQKADAIRRIFRLAVEGHGIGTITRRLNSEKVPPIAASGHWVRSYVNRLLNTRLVLGEYQPHLRPGGKPTPDGPPVPGFYPAVVTEDEYHRAQAALSTRRSKGGRPGRGGVNLFTGLLRDARGGGPVWVLNKGKGPGCRLKLVSAESFTGVSESTPSFPADVFERAILSRLREISPAEILPQGDDAAARVLLLSGRLAAVEARVEKIKAQLLDVDDDQGDVGVDVLRALEKKRAGVAAELAAAQQEAASPAAAAWGEFRSLCDVLDAAPDPADTRLRLRAALRRAVESVHCLFTTARAVRMAAVRVQFRGSPEHRDYLIVHWPGGSNGHGARPADTEVWSFADVKGATTRDLRRPKDAAKLERLLATIDVSRPEKPKRRKPAFGN